MAAHFLRPDLESWDRGASESVEFLIKYWQLFFLCPLKVRAMAISIRKRKLCTNWKLCFVWGFPWTFHVLDPPEKTKHVMNFLRPVLNSSRQDAFRTVEFLWKRWRHIFLISDSKFNILKIFLPNQKIFSNQKLIGFERASTRALQNWSQNLHHVFGFFWRVQNVKGSFGKIPS